MLAHPVLLLRDPATMEAVVDSSSFHPTRGGKQMTKLEVFTLDLKVVLFRSAAFVSTQFPRMTWILQVSPNLKTFGHYFPTRTNSLSTHAARMSILARLEVMMLG